MNLAPKVVADRPALRVAEVEHTGVRLQKPARQKKGVRWARAIKLVAVALVIAAAAMFAHRALTRPVTIQASPSTVAEVREETRGPGTVQSRFPVSIGSRVAGTLDGVLVDVGQEVQKGQLLATLDRTELEALLGLFGLGLLRVRLLGRGLGGSRALRRGRRWPGSRRNRGAAIRSGCWAPRPR